MYDVFKAREEELLEIQGNINMQVFHKTNLRRNNVFKLKIMKFMKNWYDV